MLKITRDHPSLQLEGKVQTIAADFLKQHGFSYFQYLRCYDDGSVSLLANNTGLLEYVGSLEGPGPVVFSSFTDEHQKLHTYWFLWEEALPAYPVQLAIHKFGFHHGLTLVRRSKNYYDMIAVALTQRRTNVTSFYFTKLKAIESFINHFDRQHSDLLYLIDKNPIVLPPAYRDVNYQKICLPRGRIEIQGTRGNFYITSQELACLRLLLQDATYKQIAQILSLSPRTVETYILRIKQRSGISNRKDLEDLFAICP